MESTSIELGTKDSKGDTLMGSTGENFDQSEIKKRKIIRIIILVSVILLITIISLILYFCLRSNDDKKEDSCKDETCLIFEKNEKDCKCKECKPYFRLENGKCIFIYAFEAIYKISPSNVIKKDTKLFNVENLQDYKINKIQIDEKYIEDNQNYYKFKTEGAHNVLINIDLKSSSSLKGFFKNINELISINFTNDFNTTYIQNMDEMFFMCSNLNSINISDLNTENVISMNNIFSYCTNLIEINLNNLDTKKLVEYSKVVKI